MTRPRVSSGSSAPRVSYPRRPGPHATRSSLHLWQPSSQRHLRTGSRPSSSQPGAARGHHRISTAATRSQRRGQPVATSAPDPTEHRSSRAPGAGSCARPASSASRGSPRRSPPARPRPPRRGRSRRPPPRRRPRPRRRRPPSRRRPAPRRARRRRRSRTCPPAGPSTTYNAPGAGPPVRRQPRRAARDVRRSSTTCSGPNTDDPEFTKVAQGNQPLAARQRRRRRRPRCSRSRSTRSTGRSTPSCRRCKALGYNKTWPGPTIRGSSRATASGSRSPTT